MGGGKGTAEFVVRIFVKLRGPPRGAVVFAFLLVGFARHL